MAAEKSPDTFADKIMELITVKRDYAEKRKNHYAMSADEYQWRYWHGFYDGLDCLLANIEVMNEGDGEK
ncbi:MAG: hypothetical protein FWD71_01425 [Oscillospiraceae bacterium]|nr:hypothetical protein [Oscillospiraceae bacterium]